MLDKSVAMLQSHQIKNERVDLPVIADSMKSICNDTACVGSCNPNSHRQVLVNFGLNRKIVLTLNGKETLNELFTSYVSSEPAFSGLLKDSYVIFQVFSKKFGTWVDVDPKGRLRDGAVLKAVFFPIVIERDESNPFSIRQKQKKLEFLGVNRRPIEIISIEDDVGVTNSAESKHSSKENEGTKKRKRKCKKIEKEPINQEVNKYVRAIKRPRMTQEQSNGELSDRPQDHAAQNKITNAPPLYLNKIQPTNSQQVSDSLAKHIGFQERIEWTERIRYPAKRWAWAKMNAKKMWHCTLFTGLGHFVYKKNRIVYHYHNSNVFKHSELFWGCCSFKGLNIIVPVGQSITVNKLSQILQSEVINSVMNGKGKVTVQYLMSLKNQFECVKETLLKNTSVCNSIDFSEWPCYIRDISPLEHAWKLVGEKVKNIPCSSKQKMISIVSSVWKNDLDVQSLYTQSITFLPEMIESIIQQEGKCQKI